MSDFLEGSTIRTVMLGCGMIGFTAGAVGTFSVVRKESLIGDAVSHAALPGIVLGFVIFQKSQWGLACGAMLTGWLALYLVNRIQHNRRITFDAGLAAMLSFFFGLGLMLKTAVQRRSTDPDKLSIDRYLFGQASFMNTEDLQFVFIGSGFILLPLLLFWKYWKWISFDPEQASVHGLPIRFLQNCLLFLQVFAIVLGLQAVGVVLMSALLVAPAIAARYWHTRLERIIWIAGAIGACSGVFGAILADTLSSNTAQRSIPTGPTIVLIATSFVFLSGAIRAWRQQQRSKRHSYS